MILDRLLAAIALVAASPVLAICALAIVLDDRGPVLFSQSRVGKNGRPFRLRKLRSMRTVPVTTEVTAAGDPRITRVGSLLRRYKLDELPQLWNVLMGEMALIGPRPEVPRFVNLKDPVWQQVLAVLPGITDLATLLFRDEEQMLSASSSPQAYYESVVLPEKLQLNLSYIKQRSLRSDVKLLYLTVRYSFWPFGFKAENIRQSFLN
jgi:lipopolysaccharide/colanic/teichoic acid biosynthesis glycosyltransferase